MIPIFRGKKIDSEEFVEGDITYSSPYTTEKGLHIAEGYELWYREHDLDMADMSDFVDPKTIEISFDNGETFDTIEDVVEAVNIVKHQAEIWKEK